MAANTGIIRYEGIYTGKKDEQPYGLVFKTSKNGFEHWVYSVNSEESTPVATHVIQEDLQRSISLGALVDTGVIPTGLPTFFSSVNVIKGLRGEGIGSFLGVKARERLEHVGSSNPLVHILGFLPKGFQRMRPRYQGRGYI